MKTVISITVALLACGSTFGQGIDRLGITDMESTIVEIIFYLAFITQIFGLSFFLPRFLMRKTAGARENTTISKSIVYRFTIMNNVILIIGFLVLALLSFHPVFTSIVPTLLAIGIYFLLQVSPIVFNKQLIEHSKVSPPNGQHSFTLSDVIHPMVVGVAGFLFLSYLIVALISWDGSLNTQLLQLAIFVGVNTYLAFMIGKNVRRIKQSSGEEKLKQTVNLMKMAPFFVYISIGISLYYFGKIFLFGFELYEYRPIMMSITLLLLGLLVINQISYSTSGKQ